jgi:glutamate synthase (NADPH/NADH) large chain
VLVLESPRALQRRCSSACARMGEARGRDRLHLPVAGGRRPNGLRAAIAASARSRGGGARRLRHVILTDENMGPDRAPIPMILATGACTRISCARACAPSPRSTCARRVPRRALFRRADRRRRHHGQRLSGAGDDRRPPSRGPVRRSAAGQTASRATSKAVDEGLLKIMSKMGISVISSYRGGYNFEAIGLSRALVGEFFPGMPAASPASACRHQRHADRTTRPGTRTAWRCRSAASTSCARRRATPSTQLIHTAADGGATD